MFSVMGRCLKHEDNGESTGRKLEKRTGNQYETAVRRAICKILNTPAHPPIIQWRSIGYISLQEEIGILP